jgi:hypothetical protein
MWGGAGAASVISSQDSSDSGVAVVTEGAAYIVSSSMHQHMVAPFMGGQLCTCLAGAALTKYRDTVQCHLPMLRSQVQDQGVGRASSF